MDGNSIEAILDDLYRNHVLAPVQPGEFTVRMLADRGHLSTNQAKAAIDRAIAAGDVEQVCAEGTPVMRDTGGHAAQVYRKKR
jgi:hypothetical protein